MWLRQLLALQDAGLTEVFWINPPAGLRRDPRVKLRLREGLPVEPAPALVLRADLVFHPALPGMLRGRALDPAELHRLDDGAHSLFAAGAEAATRLLDGGADALHSSWAGQAEPLARPHFVVPADDPRAEPFLLASLRKGVDGVIARVLNRRLSLALTARLARTPITPNQVTLIASCFGALSIYFFAQGGYTGGLLGGAALQAQSVIDGCDGELARLRYQRSPFGEWLDNLCDDAINLGALLAAGYGLGGPWWTLAGAAGAALLFYDFTLYYALLTADPPTGNPFRFRWWFQAEAMGPYVAPSGSWPRRLVAALSGALQAAGRRDFYLFLFFAAGLCGVLEVAVGWHAFGSLVAGCTALLQWLLAGPPRAARAVRGA